VLDNNKLLETCKDFYYQALAAKREEDREKKEE